VAPTPPRATPRSAIATASGEVADPVAAGAFARLFRSPGSTVLDILEFWSVRFFWAV
jgi:hypothetical protein